VLEAQPQGLPVELERPDPGEEGQAQHGRHLRWDLSGVGIDRVAAEQDEIERALVLEGGGERPGGGPGVAAGEGEVGDVDALIGAEGDRLAQHVLRRGGSERDDREGSPGGPGQLVALGDSAAAVVVHVELEALALEATVGPEGHGLDLGDLLDERGDAQRSGHQSSKDSG
jgi:hypothetical protein